MSFLFYKIIGVLVIQLYYNCVDQNKNIEAKQEE